MKSTSHLNRRQFLGRIGAATLAAPFFTRHLMSAAPGGLVRHASFGASGMAGADLSSLTSNDWVRLVAVAEVDLNRVGDLKSRFPDVRIYQDWRELLDKEANNIDSVNVSTPDHMHGPIGMSCLQLGKAVYGQKPLTHDIYETRRLTEVAREKNLVTQMGIQIHSTREYRLAVKLIQDGTIGKIKEVHTFSNKKWGDTSPKPDREDPVPAGLDWDLWLGVTEKRPFIGNGYYHPGNWRKRLDFGTGTFGDMGCHIYDPVFAALALTAPLSVRSEGPTPNADNWAMDAAIHYVFPGTPYTEGDMVNVTWYDGDARPPKHIEALLEGDNVPGQGSIFIGTKGVMLLPHIASPQLYPDADYRTFRMPEVETIDHWTHFAKCVREGGKPWANFDYAGPLTEAVLLGGVATRFPHATLVWDAAAVQFTNLPEANQYVKRPYRKGWEVRGM